MSLNTSHNFKPDNNDGYRNEAHGRADMLPDTSKKSASRQPLVISREAKHLTLQLSIETQLREALTPHVHDINILKPKRYRELSKSTYEALVKEAEAENAAEAREALVDLIALLKENLLLSSLLNQNIKRVQKA